MYIDTHLTGDFEIKLDFKLSHPHPFCQISPVIITSNQYIEFQSPHIRVIGNDFSDGNSLGTNIFTQQYSTYVLRFENGVVTAKVIQNDVILNTIIGNITLPESFYIGLLQWTEGGTGYKEYLKNISITKL